MRKINTGKASRSERADRQTEGTGGVRTTRSSRSDGGRSGGGGRSSYSTGTGGRRARITRGAEAGRNTRRTTMPDGRSVTKTHTEVEATPVEEFVAGRRPVLEALRAGRPMNKLMIGEGSEGGSLAEIIGKAKAAGVLMQKVPKAHLNSVAGEGHQGVVAYIAAHEYADLEDVIANRTTQPPLIVLLDEVTDPHNLGAVLRTAEGVGAQGVVIPKRRSVPLTGTVAKAAAGALEYLPVARVANLTQAMEQLKKAGYWVVGSGSEAGTLYTEVDYRGPIAVVIGSEGQGISRLVRERCDYVVQLPMHGQVQSLNASVAAGVLLYEIVRQRS